MNRPASHPRRRRRASIALALAVVLAAGLSAPVGAAAPASAAELDVVIVDDATTTGTNRFEFPAKWVAESGLDATRWQGGTEHWVRAGDTPTMTFRFTGVQAELLGNTDPAHGTYAFSVDGGPETIVDAYSATRQYRQLLFSTGVLPAGAHTVVLRVTGEKNPAASRAGAQIDFARVTRDVVAATGVTIDQAPLVLETGATATVVATVTPADATDPTVLWSTEDAAVATVAADGTVTAVAPGQTAVVATTRDGGFTARRTVTVTKARTELSGAVADTNFHYVTTKSFDDYRRKHYPDVVGMTDRSWQATAWQQDRINAQFVLWTTGERKTGVRVESVSLSGPGGAVLDDGITATLVSTVMAGRGRPSLGKPQEPIPDVLAPVASVEMAPRSVQPIWMTVDVPADSAPGAYEGTIVVVSDQGDRIELALSLEVLDLRLPAPHDWEQFIDLWQNPYAVARTEGIPADRLWSDEHFAAMLPHYQRLRDAGQDVITATVVKDPWASQTYDPYGSMVQWTKKADGTWAFDFDVFDRWVEFMMEDVGIDGQIDAYSMVNWASRIEYFDVAQNRTVNASVPVGTQVWRDMWTAFLAEFGPHLKEKGWFDITYMAMDERALDDLLKAVDLIDEVAPGLKVGAAMNYNSLHDPRLDRIDKISVSSDHVLIGDGEFEEVAAHRRELGLITSIYYCVGIYPNTFVRSNLAEAVWGQWKTTATQSDGYLRWAYDSFVEDPFTTVDFKTWESGDAAQVYPHDISSVRWEHMNEGIRDAEKVRWLSARSADAAATLNAAMTQMANPGLKKDPFGGVIDPGDVDIPAEVDRLQAALDEATRAYLAERQARFDVSISDTTLTVGAAATATVTGLEPGSTASFELHSDPVSLGTAIADAQGTARLTFTVPAIDAGAHELVVAARDAAGTPGSVSLAVTVRAAPNPGGDPSGEGSSSGSATSGGAGSGTAAGGGLASTGQDPALITGALVVALLLLAGGVIALRRRRSVGR
ncbi:glycoside hydrolase domain-containing protein [Streptomyces sp. AC495_CC817]|uniref:glycoside hydrolase domain-containing protein n=1 Tax=Streptomyces sp. AC495_CC817 TaxID=2823900 RepID=UPI001C27F3E8|nr:glycoside hydrolase domain-containing protein [Streptomyces sp. AC495_CC817]